MGELGKICFASGIQPGPVGKVLGFPRFCSDLKSLQKSTDFHVFREYAELRVSIAPRIANIQ